MNPRHRTLLAALAALLAWTSGSWAQADYAHVRTTMDGAGSVSTNTVALDGKVWRHVGACAQPGGVQTGSGGGLSHAAGFLQAADVKCCTLDHDTNGVPDELDWDNDGDGLADVDELDGSAFQGYAQTDSNDADTDGDGMDDAQESAAMFDPLDPNHRLAFTEVRRTGDAMALCWIGKGGGITNRIVYTDDLAAGAPTNILVSVADPGGTSPWYKVVLTNEHLIPQSTLPQLFGLRIAP